jgi:hypothetical protein
MRFIFGCEALASVVLTPTIIRELQDFGLSGSVFSIALLILTLFILVTGIAWLSLRKGWSSARASGVAASLINLLLFPIGTNKYSGAVLSVLQVALLMVAADLWYRWAGRHGLASQVMWISLLQIEAAVWANVLCHELGHVFAGWATEMKLRTFVIGPLRFTLRSGKWGCEFNPADLWGVARRVWYLLIYGTFAVDRSS